MSLPGLAWLTRQNSFSGSGEGMCADVKPHSSERVTDASVASE